MEFRKVHRGSYKAVLSNTADLWVEKDHKGWVWFVGRLDTDQRVYWCTAKIGPFETRREALEDALKNYKNLLD